MRTPRSTVRSVRTAAVLGASLALALSACGGSSSSSTSAGGGSSNGGGSGKKIVYITPNPVGSNSFLKLGVDGAQQAAQAAGAQFKLYESTDPTSISQNVDAAVRSKPDLIIGISFSFDDVFAAATKAHPDQQFLEVDSCVKDQPKNLTCVAFKEHEAAYVAGVEAGKITKSGKIGVVAALDTPFIHRWVEPFFEGAKSVNPGVQGTALYVGGQNPFSDPARAKAQAQTLAGRGVDVVLAAASAGNAGVFQAAAANNFKAFGVDSNQCPDSKGAVIDNVLKRVDVAEAAAIKDVLGGTAGGSKVYGLKEQGVGVGAVLGGQFLTDCTVASDSAATAAAKKANAAVVAGTVTVKDPLQG
jgi:basic membrane protein A and related proteins